MGNSLAVTGFRTPCIRSYCMTVLPPLPETRVPPVVYSYRSCLYILQIKFTRYNVHRHHMTLLEFCDDITLINLRSFCVEIR